MSSDDQTDLVFKATMPAAGIRWSASWDTKGGAAIVKSSELVELLGVSDRVLVMREGRFVGELPGLTRRESHISANALEEKFMSLAAASKEG